LYWRPERQLFADTPAGKQFSQHSNVLAVLGGVVTGSEARALMERCLADTSLTGCSYYFLFYLHAALTLTGLGDRYVDLLSEWFGMLDRHLTTWAERSEDAANTSRSDCHAWTASPNIELFRTVLGIDSAAPGFSRVRIRPFLGKLQRAFGSIPHPRGEISVRLQRQAASLTVEISLPPAVTGEFVWGERTRPLSAGVSKFTM
jgi:hypothetical protein